MKTPIDFKPYLLNTHGNIWSATISMPGVGEVTTKGNSWEEAQMRLWIVSEAVAHLASKEVKPFAEWTDDEWRSTLRTVREVLERDDIK